jgi:hypothetical protein
MDGVATAGRMPWTVGGLAVLIGIEAVLMLEHARRLLTQIVTAEETLGIAALSPLDREVPAAVLEGFVAVGLVVAAITVIRRSRLSLLYVLVAQAVIVLDAVLRFTGGLAVAPAIGLLVLASLTGALALAVPTRRWCTEPIW